MSHAIRRSDVGCLPCVVQGFSTAALSEVEADNRLTIISSFRKVGCFKLLTVHNGLESEKHFFLSLCANVCNERAIRGVASEAG